MTNVGIIKIDREPLACDEILLADLLFKQYCEIISGKQASNKSVIELEVDLSYLNGSRPALSQSQQLVLTRSCLSDVIYSLNYLGVWCSMRTVKLYLTEFSRLFGQLESSPGDLIGATSTILNCLYGRLEQLANNIEGGSSPLNGCSKQLKTLISYMKNLEKTSDKSWPICIVHVRKKVIAKVIALWLNDLAIEDKEYTFIKPNYVVGSSRKHRNRISIDSFDHHHEASIRDFRSGRCNTLIISTVEDKCLEMLKCNLVVLFDHPTHIKEFLRAKSNCRAEMSKCVIFMDACLDGDIEKTILEYIKVEDSGSNKKDVLGQNEAELMNQLEEKFPPFPKGAKSPATIYRSMNIINKYCAKLPSDSFTKLTSEWSIKEIVTSEGKSYYCELRLPINSPVRQAIIGPVSPTKAISMRLAAYTACKVLHKAGEVDDNLSSIKKESIKLLSPCVGPKGSTKHRQYYRKRIAKVFSGSLVSEDFDCYLYEFKMILTCPLPDNQNRRGRRVIDPNETWRNYAIICTQRLPKICSFPIYTRSGEVMISIDLIQEGFRLDSTQIGNLRLFHEYTFSKVLRLDKYPTIFEPKNSPFTVLLAPVIDHSGALTKIDWSFVEKIVDSNNEPFQPDEEQRRHFEFKHEDYIDAVVIPWYRSTDRQQFAYYVAEICTDMNPGIQFPDKHSGYDTFFDYYKSKYNVDIFNKDQPVLDVDHTSARLNLLTPRYVNRKGRTLPSITAKTRKESRESLIQKQLLIPELCTIHPFPASLWRKAVCLPTIFYRLNSLYLAEELRREVAEQIKVGFVEPARDFEWPKLDFGWSLTDVIKLQTIGNEAEARRDQINESDGSWSMSDDEKDDEDDDGNRFMQYDSSSQHKSSVRELFVPFLEDADPVQIDHLDRHKLTDIATKRTAHPETLIHPCEDEKSTLWIWRNLMETLDKRARQTMKENPDLFKNNDVELVAVDESRFDYDLETLPTFGELLPNRDVDANWSCDEWKKIKFDPSRSEIYSEGPGPNVILQALTMSNASDGINLERLETVGDSFLKYSITAYLYCRHPMMHEGKLSYLRSNEISNANLYRLGIEKKLGELMSATKFEPNDNWLAPGYSVTGSSQADGNKCEIDKALAEVPYDLLQQHSIPDKSIADCVEALIGAYLTASGSRAALLFMKWLGLEVIPSTFDLEADLEQAAGDDSIWRWLEIPSSPLICKSLIFDEHAYDGLHHPCDDEIRAEALDELHDHYSTMEEFERKIQYSFKDKAYLVQAFTHNSYCHNHVTDCHQRLEFLGDALLDYLITRYLFEDPRCHSPGTLTDLRSALVNNTFFASLAVKYNFHKYLKFISDDLSNVIDGFVRKFKFESRDAIVKGFTLLINEGESEYAEDIEVPKALGDVFESVAGAIYLDSGMSLDQVWSVYFKMMKPEIEYFSSHVPKSPIRELLESMPQNVRFSPSELAPDRKHRVTAEVFGLGRFTGVGRNKHSAKSTAAKRALRMLAIKRRALSEKQEELPDITLRLSQQKF